MKYFPKSIIFLTLILLLNLELVGENIKFAVFDLKNEISQREYVSLGKVIPDLMELYMMNSQGVEVLERRKIREILREKEITLSNTSDMDSIQIGKLIGADYLCFGSFSAKNGKISISARIVSASTSEVKSSVTKEGTIESLNGVIESTVESLMKSLSENMKVNVEYKHSNLIPAAALAKFIDAVNSSDKSDFNKALVEIRECLSLDPAYSDSRTRFKEIPLPEKFSIPADFINNYPYDFKSFISTDIRFIDKNTTVSTRSFFLVNDGKEKLPFSLKELNIGEEGQWQETRPKAFYYDKKNNVLLKLLFFIKGDTATVKIFDIKSTKEIASWDIKGHGYDTNSFTPAIFKRDGAEDLISIIIPLKDEKPSSFTLTECDMKTGKILKSLKNLRKEGSSMTKSSYPYYAISNEQFKKDRRDDFSPSQKVIEVIRFDKDEERYKILTNWNLNTGYSFIDNTPLGSPLIAIYSGNQRVLNIIDPKSGKYILSRNDIDFDSLRISALNFFKDQRRYFYDRCNSFIFQEGILYPPLEIKTTAELTKIFDINNDGVPEIVSNGTIYKFTESINILPSENNLVSTWVMTTQFNEKSQSDFKANNYDCSKWLDSSWEWDLVKNIYMDIAIHAAKSLIGNSENVFNYDERGIIRFLEKNSLVPEKDVDDYSRKKAYHLIKPRWQATIKLDYLAGEQFSARLEIIDNSMPVFKPAYVSEKKDNDIVKCIFDVIKEGRLFLEKQVPPIVINNDALSGKTSVSKYKIVVTPINLPNLMDDPKLRNVAGYLTNILNASVLSEKGFQTLERLELEKIFSEKKIKSMSGNESKDEIIPSGYIMSGFLSPSVDGIHLLLRVYDTETAILVSTVDVLIGKGSNDTSIKAEIERFIKITLQRIEKYNAYKFNLLSDLYLDYAKFVISRKGIKGLNTNAVNTNVPKQEDKQSENNNNYLAGTVTKDTIIDMKNGDPCVKAPLLIKQGAVLTIAENAVLKVQNSIKSEAGAGLVMKPGSKMIIESQSGKLILEINLDGFFRVEGTQELPVTIENKSASVAGIFTGTPFIINAMKKKSDYYSISRNDYYETVVNYLNTENIEFFFNGFNTIKLSNCQFNYLKTHINYDLIDNYANFQINNCLFKNISIKNSVGSFNNCKADYLDFTFQILSIDPEGNDHHKLIFPTRLDEPLIQFKNSAILSFNISSEFSAKYPIMSFESCKFKDDNPSNIIGTMEVRRRSKMSIKGKELSLKEQMQYLHMECPLGIEDKYDSSSQFNILLNNCYFGKAAGTDNIKKMFKDISLKIDGISPSEPTVNPGDNLVNIDNSKEDKTKKLEGRKLRYPLEPK